MTNLASEAMNARCGDHVWEIIGFRGVRPDSEEKPDDRKLTLDRVILYRSGWADRLADGPTGLAALGGRLFRRGVDTALAPCNHFLTTVYVDVSMRKHRVKRKEASYSPTKLLLLST
jgi:hypothetical protein